MAKRGLTSDVSDLGSSGSPGPAADTDPPRLPFKKLGCGVDVSEQIGAIESDDDRDTPGTIGSGRWPRTSEEDMHMSEQDMFQRACIESMTVCRDHAAKNAEEELKLTQRGLDLTDYGAGGDCFPLSFLGSLMHQCPDLFIGIFNVRREDLHGLDVDLAAAKRLVQSLVPVVRNQVADWILERRDFFAGFLLDDSDDSAEPAGTARTCDSEELDREVRRRRDRGRALVQAYAKNMKESNMWFDHLSIAATSAVYNVDVKTWSSKGPDYDQKFLVIDFLKAALNFDDHAYGETPDTVHVLPGDGGFINVGHLADGGPGGDGVHFISVQPRGSDRDVDDLDVSSNALELVAAVRVSTGASAAVHMQIETSRSTQIEVVNADIDKLKFKDSCNNHHVDHVHVHATNAAGSLAASDLDFEFINLCTSEDEDEDESEDPESAAAEQASPAGEPQGASDGDINHARTPPRTSRRSAFSLATTTSGTCTRPRSSSVTTTGESDSAPSPNKAPKKKAKTTDRSSTCTPPTRRRPVAMGVRVTVKSEDSAPAAGADRESAREPQLAIDRETTMCLYNTTPTPGPRDRTHDQLQSGRMTPGDGTGHPRSSCTTPPPDPSSVLRLQETVHATGISGGIKRLYLEDHAQQRACAQSATLPTREPAGERDGRRAPGPGARGRPRRAPFKLQRRGRGGGGRPGPGGPRPVDTDRGTSGQDSDSVCVSLNSAFDSVSDKDRVGTRGQGGLEARTAGTIDVEGYHHGMIIDINDGHGTGHQTNDNVLELELRSNDWYVFLKLITCIYHPPTNYRYRTQ